MDYKLTAIDDAFLVSAFNHIEHVKQNELKNKKRCFMARQALETAQKNIIYVLKLHSKD